MSTMTLDEGVRFLEAAMPKAKSMNLTVAASVVDERGDLVAAYRMDGCLWYHSESSRGKAMATVTHGGIPSSELLERASRPVSQMLVHILDGRIVPQPGAVPINKGRVLIGAVGVAGRSSGEQDEEIAKAGAAAIEG